MQEYVAMISAFKSSDKHGALPFFVFKESFCK